MGYVMNEVKLNKPLTFFWEPTEYCNLKCLHCYTNSSPYKKNVIDFEHAKKIIDLMFKEGIYSLGIGGGEPLLIDFLPNLIKYITDKGMQVSISTNGLLLTEQLIKQLKDAGLKIIQLSIDGIKECHEYLRGKGTFDKVIEKIDLIKKYNISFRIGCVVNKYNYNKLDEFIELMKNKGVEVINFFRFMPSNNRYDLCLDKYQLLEVSKKLISYYKKNRYGENKFYITFESLSFFAFLIEPKFIESTNCTAGIAKFNLSCSGDVTPCNYIHRVVGNINEMPISDIWKKITYKIKEQRDIPDECFECIHKEYCRGGCKGFSFINSAGFLQKDASCFKEIINEGD